MHDFYANLGGIHSLNCHFIIEIYMFLYSNKSVFNFSIPQHLRNHVLLHLFQLCQKNSEYFSGFCLFSHNIFKKWLQIFSVIQVCDCAATLKITFATSVQVRTISLILFFKNSLHSYWKKDINPLKRAVNFALLFQNIPQNSKKNKWFLQKNYTSVRGDLFIN